MTFNEVMKQLESLGTEQTRKIYTNHGADLEMYGVSIADLKKVLKPIKKDKDLGKKLLFSGNTDAIYLSKWIVDVDELTISDLESILDSTDYYMIIDNVIASIAARKRDVAWDIVHKWIDHKNPRYRQSAYGVLSLILSNYDDELIDRDYIKNRLDHVSRVIHDEANRVRYSMNSFLISAGGYLSEYTDYAIELGKSIGKVHVSMGKTSCKVPFAPDYIPKMISRGSPAKKRKIDW